MAKEVLNIVFICDENYAMPTAVAITSLKANQASTTECNVFVLGVGLKNESVEKINSLRCESCVVQVLKIELTQEQKNVAANRKHVSHAALLKFDLPKVFSNFDKILYLDSDILVQKDLSVLYQIDISEFYAAAVKDVLTYRDKNHLKKINFFGEAYFNSGVILFNLKKMRNENISKKLIDFRLNSFNLFMDQDTLNVVLQRKVLFLEPHFNLLPCFFEWCSIEELENFYGTHFPKKISAICKNATILHFGGEKKPWVYELGILSKIYKKYFSLSPYKNSFLKLRREFRVKKMFSTLVRKMPPFRGIYRELAQLCELEKEFNFLKFEFSKLKNKIKEKERL